MKKSRIITLICFIIATMIIVVLMAKSISKNNAVSTIEKLFPEIADQKIESFFNQISSNEDFRSSEYSKIVALTEVKYEITDITQEKDNGKVFYIISLTINCQSDVKDMDNIRKSLVAYEVEECLGKNLDEFNVDKYKCRFYSTDHSSDLYFANMMTVYLNGELVHSPKYNIGEVTIEKWENVTNDDDRNICWGLAEQAVKSKLKSPSSAKFPFSYSSNGVTIEQKGDSYRVKSYVDADNSFGANLRSNFTVYIEKSGSTFTVTSCTIEE